MSILQLTTVVVETLSHSDKRSAEVKPKLHPDAREYEILFSFSKTERAVYVADTGEMGNVSKF
jgi:hypothetical protein